MNASDLVCHYAEPGKTWYVLLSGEVSIWIPQPMSQLIEPLNNLKQELEQQLNECSPGTYPKVEHFHIMD